MRRSVALDGPDWELSGFIGPDAAEQAAAGGEPSMSSGSGGPGTIAASVPGSVIDDLWRAGVVADPYVGRNSLLVEWVPQRAWLYRRTLRLGGLGDGGQGPGELADGERAWLAFDGVDHACSVWLDGKLLGRHQGMFVPFELEVTERLRGGGEHALAVVVEPAPPSESQVGRTSRVRVHKSRMGYGWDFCPRMINQGIWQSIRLEIGGPARLTDVWARPSLAANLAHADITVHLAFDATEPVELTLDVELRDGERVVASSTTAVGAPAGPSNAELALELDDPRPWWPNGLGEAFTYRLRARITTAAGVTLDEREVPVGFRRLALDTNDEAPAGARRYVLLVNGRRVYVNGWNWTPIDPLYGVPRPAKLAHLLRLAARANVNLLRVWGGGLIESESFYAACDRLGILVWQEFSQSSSGVESSPAADVAFIELMRQEAERIVPLRRNHPSLAFWCGGNELEDERGPLDDERSPALAALHEVVSRLDPDRLWLPTSPTGPHFFNRLDLIDAQPEGQHDVHGMWEHQGLEAHYVLANRSTSLFHSEFGVEGMTNRRSHERLIEPEQRWPATRTNAVYRHLGVWWINEPLVQDCFGGRLADLETLRRASQWLQATGLAYIAEADRRRAFHNGGSIPWQFNEAYPNAWCTAAVDHHGDPKPAYFAVAHAYESVHVSASFDRAAWAGHDRFESHVFASTSAGPVAGALVEARLVSLDGARIASASWTLDLPAGPAVEIGHLGQNLAHLPADLFLLDLLLTAPVANAASSTRYLFSRSADFSALLDLAPATIDVGIAADGVDWRLAIRHRSGPAAIGLVVEDDRAIETPGWAEASAGLLDVFVGETRTIDVHWADAPPDDRRLRIGGWNVEPIVLA